MRKSNFLPASGFLLSAVLHGVIFLFVGGTIVFQGYNQEGIFEAVTDSIDDGNYEDIPLPEEIAPIPDEPLEMEEDPLPNISESVSSSNEISDDIMDTSDLITTSSVMSIQPTVSITVNPGSLGNKISSKSVGSRTFKSNKATSASAFKPRRMDSAFGSKGPAQDGLTGTLYDLKQTKDGKPTSIGTATDNTNEFEKVARKFANSFDPKVLEPYFTSPKPLGTYQFFIPMMKADEAPKAFNVEKHVKPSRWLIHYKGKVSPPYSGRFRFVGFADDILVVNINGENVFDGSLTYMTKLKNKKQTYGKAQGVKFIRQLYAGKWFKMIEGQTYDMQALVGETPGGAFSTFLLIEEKGKEYEKREDDPNFPLLPVFRTVPTKLPEYKLLTHGPPVAEDDELFFGVQLNLNR